MSEQAFAQSNLSPNSLKARKSLEFAREAHEKYLICQENTFLQKAIEGYVDAVKYDPTLPEAYYRLASLMWEQGQISISTAIEQCKTAVNIAPTNINAHIYTGYFMKMAQDFGSAEKEFKSAINIGKINSARPRLILSMSILQKMNNGQTSVGDFVEFLYYFLSGSLMICWDKPSLRMFYKTLSDDLSVFVYKTTGTLLEKLHLYPCAAKLYDCAVKSTSHSEIFYHKMGDLSLKYNSAEIASECYKRALEANPLNRKILIKLATVTQTFFPDNIDETIDYYNRLLEFNLDIGSIYYELGHLYIAKKDKINAISAFKLALSQDSENPFYNNSLAYAFVKAELYDDAIEYYQKAVKLNPDKVWTAIVCQALGAIYFEIQGNVQAAVATFQAGMILDPENIDLYLSLGDVYMADGSTDDAIRTYCDAITIAPQEFKTYSKLGMALWEKDFLEEALVAYHKAINLNPDYDIAQNNLGVLYLDGLGEPAEAQKYFLRAIELNPNYTLAYFNAGRTAQILKDTVNAAAYYQMALDLNKLTCELDDEDIKDRINELFDL